ncbi:unnamed protein product, partial [Staurois parvus]
RKNSQNVGRAQDKAQCFTIYNIQIIYIKISNLPPVLAPVRPDVTGTGTTEAGCWHRPKEMAGDTAGDTSRERRIR